MNTKMLREIVQELVDTIDLCYSNELSTPTLILLYSAIDIMAWLIRDVDQEKVYRSDFMSWVETYILPYSNQVYIPIDLYGARCSIIHSYSAESSLSKDEEASKLFYAWGEFEKEELQKMIDESGEPNTKAINLDILISDTKNGINRFLDKEGNNQLVLDRAKKFFIRRSISELKANNIID